MTTLGYNESAQQTDPSLTLENNSLVARLPPHDSKPRFRSLRGKLVSLPVWGFPIVLYRSLYLSSS